MSVVKNRIKINGRFYHIVGIRNGKYVVTSIDEKKSQRAEYTYVYDPRSNELRPIGLVANPGEMLGDEELDKAIDMFEEFHGKEGKEIIEAEIEEHITDTFVMLGELVEIGVIPVRSEEEWTIEFGEGECYLLTNAEGKQLYIQSNVDLVDTVAEILDSDVFQSLKKERVVVGEFARVVYFTDKHHLEGGDEQKEGVEYEHEFGEKGGEVPLLVYNVSNDTLEIVGGSYEVRDVGIYN